MTHIKILVSNIGKEHQNTTSVAAYLILGLKDFLLDSVSISFGDIGNVESDFEVLDDFLTQFEILAREGGLRLEVDSEVEEMHSELTANLPV